MRHDAIADLASFFARQVRHADVGARSYAARGRRGSTVKLVTSPLGAWLRMMVLKRAYKDGWRGACAAAAVATSAAMKHAILLEHTHAPPEPTPPPAPPRMPPSGPTS